MARVAYIGNFEGVPYSTENDVRKAFEHLGHEVVQLQENKVSVPQVLQTALSSDLLLITGTWDEVLPLPDMLDVFHDCAEKGIPTATLHLDTFWGKSRGGRKWWRAPMFHTAYIFTADGDYQEQWKAFGKNHIWLPPAVRHDAAHFGKYRPEYACDVAFVGSNGVGYHEDVWGYRKELVNRLKEICQRRGWSFRNPGGELDKPNAGKIDRSEDMNDFYSSATVTVGDSLCLKREESKYFSDRVTECWGRGGFVVMPQINALEQEMGLSQPSYKWGDWEDLERQLEIALKMSTARETVRNANQKHVAENHTYVNRVEELLEVTGLKEKPEKTICGHCYHDQGVHTDYCAYKKGSRWDLAGINAPDSTPLRVSLREWRKDESGRYNRVTKSWGEQ